MAKLTIGRGTNPNDGTGDNLRDGANKINLNFDEIYTAIGDGTTVDGTIKIADDSSTVATISANGNATFSGIVTATSFSGSGANLTSLPASGKGTNLFINGDMRIDQRYGGVAHTIDGSDFVVDRWLFQSASTQEQPTIQQVDVTADTDPWNAGFRKAVKITNGNQTGGAGGDDTIIQLYKFEAQDIASSGWDYTSASSYVTLSFWVKASVAMDYPYYIRTRDGTARMYSSMTGSLSADTWTKITKTIPGDSNITVNTDNGSGLELLIAPYYGTDGTASGSTLNAWKNFTSSSRWDDITTTWYTTNDATFETTGFKLEVGDSATDYDFRTYGDELTKCMRYYEVIMASGANNYDFMIFWYQAGEATGTIRWAVQKRAAPTLVQNTGTNYFECFGAGYAKDFDSWTGIQKATTYAGTIYVSSGITGATAGDGGWSATKDTAAYVHVEAEL